MKCRKAYGIMPVGENDRSAHVAQQKAPEVATPGLFYSVLGGWLNPKAGYQLFFSVQPFADVVGKENTVQEVRKALQANIEAIQRATKLLEKQSDTLTSVMKQKIRELEESKNSFFRYEGLKLYLFWGGMVCNILVFLMLLYGMLGK